jgi:hypothetical protein
MAKGPATEYGMGGTFAAALRGCAVTSHDLAPSAHFA